MSGAREDRSGGNLVFIGDVHLDRGDPELRAFLNLLDRLGQTSRRIVLMGDLFNLWIGRRELEQEHHAAVAGKLAELRGAGVVVRYLEGNRDYRVAAGYSGYALDDASDAGLVERFGGHSLFAVHGDLANRADRQYRTWRRVSRSAPVWWLFHLLPRVLRQKAAISLERRFRSTNLEFKRSFPEEAVRAYAAELMQDGYDVVALGHFHVERDLATRPPAPPGRILVLPEWKGSRRHLEVTPGGEIRFVDSPRTGC